MSENETASSGVTPLNRVLASILRDVDKAQNASNVYSAKLSRYYKNNKTLSYFPVPNGCIEEVEVDLKMAVDGVALPGPSEEEQIEQAIEIFRTIAESLSNDLGGVLRAKLKPAGTEEQQAKMAAALDASEGAAFKKKLSARVFGNLTESLETLVSAKNGMNYQATLNNVNATIDSAVLQNDAIQPVLVAMDNEDSVQQDLSTLVDGVLKHAIGAATPFELWDTPNLNVVVNSNDLAEVPEHLLTQLNVKVRQRNYKWVLNAQVSDATDPGIAAEVLEPVESA